MLLDCLSVYSETVACPWSDYLSVELSSHCVQVCSCEMSQLFNEGNPKRLRNGLLNFSKLNTSSHGK